MQNKRSNLLEIPLIRNHIESAEVRGLIGKKEFKQFFKKYYSVFLSFACRYHVDAEEARDIVQDVFIIKQVVNILILLILCVSGYRHGPYVSLQ